MKWNGLYVYDATKGRRRFLRRAAEAMLRRKQKEGERMQAHAL